MKSLRLIRRNYPDAAYQTRLDGSKIRSSIIAQALDDDKDFTLTDAQIIPKHLENSTKELGRSFKLYDISNDRLRTRARNSIISCKIIGVLESAKIINRKQPENVVFEDVIICQPRRKDLQDLRIYVSQHEAGYFQPEDIKLTIGDTVPVKIVDLRQVAFEQRFNRDLPLSEQTLENEYVAIGSINIAEYLLGYDVINEFEDGKSTILDTQTGKVVYITNSGVFLLTPNMERIFVPINLFSYKSRSNYYKFPDYVSIGDMIDFKIQAASFQPIDEARKALGLNGNRPFIVGERLSLEKHPSDILREICQNGRGTVLTGHIVKFDAIKGHDFEVEGAYGYTIKLRGSINIKESIVKSGKSLSVVVEEARVLRDGSELGKGFKASIKARFNSVFDNDIDDDFFVI